MLFYFINFVDNDYKIIDINDIIIKDKHMKKVINKIISLVSILTITFVSNFAVAKTVNTQLSIEKLPQCMDEIDNDLDGLIDYPDDDGCESPQDDLESLDDVKNISNIYISGTTIPNTTVNILRNGEIISYTKSNSKGEFNQKITGYYSGDYEFTVIVSKNDNTTNAEKFSVNVNYGSSVIVNKFYTAPILYLTKAKNSINIEGYAIANSKVEVYLVDKNNKEIKIGEAVTNKRGYYIIDPKLNDKKLEQGEYSIYSKNIIKEKEIETESRISDIEVNTNKEIEIVSGNKYEIQCDLNNDQKVDLLDFSILLLKLFRSDYKAGDFNNDGTIDLQDFSIMTYHWTGF